MRPKIINYIGGSKGDFIINFLNNKISFRSLGQSGSSAGTDTRSFGQSLPNDQLYRYVDVMIDTTYKEPFVSSHSLTNMSDDLLHTLLEKYDLYHIVVEPEWQKQVNIDFMFKVWSKKIHHSLIEKLKNTKETDEDKLKEIEYNIDIVLFSKDLPLNDKNRLNIMLEMNNLNHVRDVSRMINPICYSKLFVDPFVDVQILCETIGKRFNERFYRELLKKSFLPREITVFGHTFDVEKLGYRYYI
jgi:hypothetical protein